MVALPTLTFPRVAAIASAAALTVPRADCIVPITGTTTITSISVGGLGQVIILEFASAACQVTSGSNLKLRADYTSAVLGTLTLECDGTNWVEMARNPLNLVAADLPLYTTWAPASITQGAGITFTTQYARTVQFGKFAHIMGQFTLTSAGTAGVLIVVNLPASLAIAAGAVNQVVVAGGFDFFPAAGGVSMGVAEVGATATKLDFIAQGAGNRFGVVAPTVANGDLLSLNVSVELA